MAKLLKYVIALLLAINQVMGHVVINKARDCADANANRLEVSDERTTTIRNKNGQLVEIIHDFFREGFQIIKPLSEDDQVCLIYQHEQGDDISTCFIRELVPEDDDEQKEEQKNALCEGRPIYMLKPVDCAREPGSGRDSEGSENEGHVIEKRECTTKTEFITTCLESVTNCIRRNFWGKCREYQTDCVKSETSKITTSTC